MTAPRRRIVPTGLRLAAGVLGCTWGASALWSCLATQPPAPVNTTAISHDVYQGEITLAREALSQEWENARGHLTDLVQALAPTDELGAEGRADLAQIAFELGDYNEAARIASEVPQTSSFYPQALESRGLAQLFSCDFDNAIQTFYQLAQADPARGRVWLGVAYAWTGADSNAERELTTVVNSYGQSEHGPNARFYLAQLALWSRRPGPAQRYLGQLTQSSPDYLPGLDQRAQNWLGRHTHLMRAYFTFDTLSRLGRLGQANPARVQADDQSADQALQMLQQSPGACAPQIQRLVAARSSTANDRTAFADATRDTDHDGVPDARDRCPTQPGARGSEDGCPAAGAAIELDGNQIRIRQGFALNFAPGQDAVLDSSRPVIDGLAAMLSNPQFAWVHRIRLDGHTDNAGAPATNLALSEHRVHRVGAMLVSRGVSPDRLTFAYYGDTRPIEPGSSEDARAHNRRVEIFVTDPPMFGGVRATQ